MTAIGEVRDQAACPAFPHTSLVSRNFFQFFFLLRLNCLRFAAPAAAVAAGTLMVAVCGAVW